MTVKTERKSKRFTFTTVIIIVIAAIFINKLYNAFLSEKSLTLTERKIESFAIQNGLTLDDYPRSIIELLARNPETEDFVLNYPLLKDAEPAFSMEEYTDTTSVPLFMQWDKRWGYTEYGSDVMGLTGCGPTCLSMVTVHLLDDTTYDPAYMARYSIDNGYCVTGNGTAWALMSEGASQLGLDVTEIPLDEQRIIENLEVGNPIICIMGPGDFTTSGHFIVMTGYEDGLIRVNDPNSKDNSEKLWDYDDIYDQIDNLWVYRVL